MTVHFENEGEQEGEVATRRIHRCVVGTHPSLVNPVEAVSGRRSGRRRERGFAFPCLVALESGTCSRGRRGNQDVRQRRGYRLSSTSYPAITWSPTQTIFSQPLPAHGPCETQAKPYSAGVSLSLSFLYWQVAMNL